MQKFALGVLVVSAVLLVLNPLPGEALALPTSYTAGGYTTCLLLDTAHGKLYVGTHASPNLYVYDLVDGEPSGAPENYLVGDFSELRRCYKSKS